MALIIKDFDSYTLKYSSIKSQAFASIACHNGPPKVGLIRFLESSPLPSNSYSNNSISMCFHISRFNEIIGILRYEKPLQLYYDDAKLEAWIQTKPTPTGEPVGEQEGV